MQKLTAKRSLKGLTRALGYQPDWRVRFHAVAPLAQIGGAQAVGPLIEALTDEDPFVRGAAIRALQDIGDMRAVEPLRAALTDKDRQVRDLAAAALATLNAAPE